MNLFFEESGDFKVGTVISQQGESYQIELQSGKRIKIKNRDVLLQFASPAASEVMSQALKVADEIDLDFLWEVAGTEEFGFDDMGKEYFGHVPTPHEAAGLLIALHHAPIYFYKKGRGRFKAAPEASLKAAIVSVEKKKQQAALLDVYVEQLKNGSLPDAVKPLAQQILFKPEKNSIEYKAVEAACHALQITPQRLMLTTGGIASPKALHESKFLFENFPKGVAFPILAVARHPELPIADVEAFSIDDVTTTEIDDAFSVKTSKDDQVQIGIHIAAPGIAIQPNDAIDIVARRRLSTVYTPGDKITMLPDTVVGAYTLAEGKNCPAVSLYITLDMQQWTIVATETRAELVPIAKNLRHNDLDAVVTEAALDERSGDYPYKTEIEVLWQWAKVLEQGRMEKRAQFGLRPEQNNRVDFNFYVEQEKVSIVRRKRGAPLDKIVAELMIFANSSWGKLMHEHGVPGIYRSQGGGSGAGWAAKMQLKMVTHAAPHQGLGVDQYAWSTSPLRRYTDLVNQWQVLACIEHGVTAPLVAPFKARDAELFSIVSAFDAAYASYAEFQSTMERYWCLRWLTQEDQRQVDAVVLKEDILRLVDIPLVLRLPGMPTVAPGTQVRLDILRWDEVDLSVEARLVNVPSVAKEEVGQTDISLQDELLDDAGHPLIDEVTTVSDVSDGTPGTGAAST